MKLRLMPVLALFSLAACGGEQQSPPPQAAEAAIDYPETETVDHTDTYHGVEVADPYRWLEEDVRESERVERWVESQNAVTFAYLGDIAERDAIAERMKVLWNYERFGQPVKEGGRYYYSYNDGLQNQDEIYVLDQLDGEPTLLLDPNAWSEDGTVALASYFPSPDGRHVAYLVQDGGSDWRIARVIAVETGEVLGDELEWLKFTGLSWAADGSGFYYSRYPATSAEEKFQALNLNQAVYFHRIGTEQAEDEVVYARPDNPEWGYAASVTDDGRHLVITVWKGTDDRYQVVHLDLTDPDAEPVMLIEGFDHDYTL
ncbi:MAG: hypothetical protein V2I25_12305, partial [Woeseiaceae bacterium]|nr:hypothetical protein [Woeseiaceae bacterium]